MLGVKVRRTDAEVLRKEITRAGILDKDHAIIDEDKSVVIPVRSRPSGGLLKTHAALLVERDFPARNRLVDPIEEVREIVAIPDRLKHLLPDKWEKFGDLGVIKLDPVLVEYEHEVAEAYASVLGLKAVLKDTIGISGEFRTPTTKLLLGTDTVTTHTENGVRYRFDAARIMFSSGNMDERIRMASVKCHGEVVVDMFAGIGYFSLPLAVYQRPKEILACEINPVAHRYLIENVRLNHVENRIRPFLGDNRDLPGESFADRVIMGYVKTTHEFLPVALRLLKDGGIVHYHETCPNELLPARPIQRIVDSVHGGRVEILRLKDIKSYAPGVSHIVVDARVFKPS